MTDPKVRPGVTPHPRPGLPGGGSYDGGYVADPVWIGLDFAPGPDKTFTAERPPVMVGWQEPEHLSRGTPVRKPKGYPWPGIVLGTFDTLNGEVRYVVERVDADEKGEGCLHIFARSQLTIRFPVLSPAKVRALGEDEVPVIIPPLMVMDCVSDADFATATPAGHTLMSRIGGRASTTVSFVGEVGRETVHPADYVNRPNGLAEFVVDSLIADGTFDGETLQPVASPHGDRARPEGPSPLVVNWDAYAAGDFRPGDDLPKVA